MSWEKYGFLLTLGFAHWLLRLVVLQYCWMWFAVPLGAPFLSILHLWGITLLVGRLIPPREFDLDLETQKQFDDIKSEQLGHIIALLIIWAIAGLVSLGV